MNVPWPVRWIGWLLGDFAVALIGTKILDDELAAVFRQHAWGAMLAREAIASTTLAFVLGLTVYILRPHESAKWIWIGGVILIASHSIFVWYDSRFLRMLGGGHSVLWEIAGMGCAAGDRLNCFDWVNYTLPSIRLIAYPLGAWVASLYGDRIKVRVKKIEHEVISKIEERNE